MIRRAAIALALSLCVTSPVMGCGFCIEDKIASVYDYAMVTRALERGEYVAYCSVVGADPNKSGMAAKVANALRTIDAIDKAGVQSSEQSSMVAFAFNPTKATADEILASVERSLAGGGVDLELIRLTDNSQVSPGDKR